MGQAILLAMGRCASDMLGLFAEPEPEYLPGEHDPAFPEWLKSYEVRAPHVAAWWR